MRPHALLLALPGFLAVAAPPASAQAPSALPAQPPKLIPMPREFHAGPSTSLSAGLRVLCAAPCSSEDQFAADDLQSAATERGVPTSTSASTTTIELARLGSRPLPPGLTFDDAMKSEGYILFPSGNGGGLTVLAATAEGIFYGAQTAKQLIRSRPGAAAPELSTATVRDWPAMRFRGQDDDLSRGPIVTLDYQKKFVRTLASYKINLYSPYFEHTFRYTGNSLPAPPDGAMTPADARALVSFARQYHVTVVPEQESFGHLHHNLTWELYQPLAETPHGDVLAPVQPGSLTLIEHWFAELAQLFPGPFLHIGADETVDLGLGQTKPDVDTRGLGAVYLDFLQKITTALHPLGRKLLFWGDIAMDVPDLVKAMPESFKRETVAVAWEYNPQPKGYDRWLLPFTRGGFETWVAPGVNNWSRVYPNFNMGLHNIQGFVRDGQRLGSTGMLNTIWNDDGEGLIDQDWYGVLFGAAAGWQKGESSIPQFEAGYGEVFHGDATGKLSQAQIELMAAHSLLHDQAKTGDGSDGLFWIDPWSKDGLAVATKIRPFNHDLRLHAERALTLIAEARAAAPSTSPPTPSAKPTYDPANAYPSTPTSLRERDAIDAMELGARRLDFIGLKFQLADEISQVYDRAYAGQRATDHKSRNEVSRELSEINGINGKLADIKDTYSLLRDLYAQAWLRSNRPYGLRPVLEHYDYTIGIWLARSEKLRSAQRQFSSDAHTLPTAADLGIPPPPAGPR